MTFELVKTLNAAVPFFSDAIRTDVKITTLIVDDAAKDVGRYIAPINMSTKSGTRPRACSAILSFDTQ